MSKSKTVILGRNIGKRLNTLHARQERDSIVSRQTSCDGAKRIWGAVASRPAWALGLLELVKNFLPVECQVCNWWRGLPTPLLLHWWRGGILVLVTWEWPRHWHYVTGGMPPHATRNLNISGKEFTMKRGDDDYAIRWQGKGNCVGKGKLGKWLPTSRI